MPDATTSASNANATGNVLYYGDNLDVLRRYVADESVDLVYLDPPFNSNADYNAFFAEQDGTRSAAQIKAFEDTWRWDQAAAGAYHDFVESPAVPDRAKQALIAFRAQFAQSDMLAYLAMMAPRLVELWRVLKPSGTLYLHCDPTASHYLKLLMDSIFGPGEFLNEITWKRTHAHGSAKRYGPVHDTIFFYAKSGAYLWTYPKESHAESYLQKHFKQVDVASGRVFQAITLTGAGVRHGDSGKPWRGIDPTDVQRHWAIPGAVIERLGLTGDTVQEKLDALDEAGRIYWPTKAGGTPRLKWYADELQGVRLPDVWVDIPPISANAAERLGYPTQKPLALMERIIRASSNEGDTVLDPFCGCGTTIAAAQKLGRRWIGIDVTSLATSLIKNRLLESYGKEIVKSYKVVGEPTVVEDAERLAADDPYQFQWWALGLVGARPVEQKKGADRGIDGRLYFHDDAEGGATKQVIFSVKAGTNLSVAMARDLVGVLDREKAQIGVLLTMHEPTKPMRLEAAGAGFYESPGHTRHPRLQILTVADLLAGRAVDLPRFSDLRTFKKAPKARVASKERTPEFFAPEIQDDE